MQNFLDFIGRFHPLIVHLPIGILLIAVLFRFMLWRNASLPLQNALAITVKAGALTAVFACITGYLLSQTADYDENIVWWHQWLGIAIAVLCIGWLYLLNKTLNSNWSVGLASAVLILLMITGHLGGSLTHGEDYLSLGGGEDTGDVVLRKPIANVQQAVAYTEIVRPILSNSCYGCHGEKKAKG